MTEQHSIDVTPPENDAVEAQTGTDNSTSDTGEGKKLLSEHKGKLAIGVAATLGIMIFYNWRQKQLSKEDPEGYARIQRIKDSVKAGDASAKQRDGKKHDPAASQ
jgi:hypothetical protein